jgi:hypothetical protein
MRARLYHHGNLIREITIALPCRFIQVPYWEPGRGFGAVVYRRAFQCREVVVYVEDRTLPPGDGPRRPEPKGGREDGLSTDGSHTAC